MTPPGPAAGERSRAPLAGGQRRLGFPGGLGTAAGRLFLRYLIFCDNPTPKCPVGVRKFSTPVAQSSRCPGGRGPVPTAALPACPALPAGAGGSRQAGRPRPLAEEREPNTLSSDRSLGIKTKNNLCLDFRQLILILELCDPSDVHGHLQHIALKLCADSVRSALDLLQAKVVAILHKFFSHSASALGLDFIRELISRFQHCPKWVGRQTFAFICQAVVSEECPCGPVRRAFAPQPSEPGIRSCAKHASPAGQGPAANAVGESIF